MSRVCKYVSKSFSIYIYKTVYGLTVVAQFTRTKNIKTLSHNPMNESEFI